MVDFAISLQNILLVNIADDHVGDGTQAKSDDLVGNDTGKPIDSGALCGVQLDNGTDGHQCNRD